MLLVGQDVVSCFSLLRLICVKKHLAREVTLGIGQTQARKDEESEYTADKSTSIPAQSPRLRSHIKVDIVFYHSMQLNFKHSNSSNAEDFASVITTPFVLRDEPSILLISD